MNRKDLVDYKNNEDFINILIKKYKKKLAMYESMREYCTNAVIDELVKSHNKLVETLTEQQKRQDKIIEIIRNMDNTIHRNILFLHFVDGKSLKRISIDLNIDYAVVRQYNMLAVREFEKISKNIK